MYSFLGLNTCIVNLNWVMVTLQKCAYTKWQKDCATHQNKTLAWKLNKAALGYLTALYCIWHSLTLCLLSTNFSVSVKHQYCIFTRQIASSGACWKLSWVRDQDYTWKYIENVIQKKDLCDLKNAVFRPFIFTCFIQENEYK